MTADEKQTKTEFERDLGVMKMYMESAKNFITLSSAALALTVTFSKQILGQSAPIVAGGALKATWLLLLLSIGAGLLYQYYAGKYMEVRYAPGGPTFLPWPKVIADYPGAAYGFMVISFYIGMVVFTLSAFCQLTTWPC